MISVPNLSMVTRDSSLTTGGTELRLQKNRTRCDLRTHFSG